MIAGIVYVLGDAGWPWCAMFLCPCGCRDVICLSLVQEDRPRWRVRAHANWRASVYPSVWRVAGCRSHFIIRRGKVIWVSRNC
jgi:hypothetical protein